LHLIRHGETVTSGRTYAGRSDVALNEKGHAQALAVTRQLRNRPITLIAASPSSRARATARPLAEALSLKPLILSDLQEFDFGKMEGRPKETLGLKLCKTHARDPGPGGESLLDVWNRAASVLAALRAEGMPEETEVAVVGHFWINRMIYGRATGLSFDSACRSRHYRPATGSVVTLVASSGSESNLFQEESCLKSL
jgi:probable phosphoglycerate mutase